MQALWMLFASLMFAIMGMFVKLSADQASLAQIILFRGLPTAVGILAWACATRRQIVPPTWRLHIMRNIAGVGSIWLSFFAMSRLPLATAVTLNYTSPLFVAGWMIWQARDATDRLRTLAVIAGFAGVIAILRPTLDHSQWLPALLGLGAGCLTSIAVLQVRSLGRAGEPEWRIVLFFALSTTLTGGLATLASGWTPLSPYGWSTLMGVGISGLLGQFAMTRAFSRGSAALSSVLQYSTIPFSILLGYLFWADQPDGIAWLGMLLIASAGLASTWRTLVLSRRGG
ncbi:EamA-like transporter family protein [Pigmentiphaga humi]|uniref:EamA-like transporter family protein n=1 Tax=Pigmentiphaga humi TaxID=2478468 RepID=A0A3P4B6Q2_9BURK|nr:DMT family transporter [Pigmentiphaga humi]VCU71338.1 EamA-like transporter family protein [Pigmentiphaga humi]